MFVCKEKTKYFIKNPSNICAYREANSYSLIGSNDSQKQANQLSNGPIKKKTSLQISTK